MSRIFFRGRSIPLLTFSQVAPVADFYFRLRTSLTFSQVAPVADFAPGCACRWLFFPGRMIPSLTSLSDCACRWLLFHRSRQSLTGRASSCRCYFFPSCAYRWFFCQLARVLRWLLFQIVPVADCFFTSRDSRKLFFMLLLSLLSFSSCAYRWILCQLARVLRWVLFQVAPVADFLHRSRPSLNSTSGCAHRWLLLKSRPLLIFPQFSHVADFLSWSLDSVADFFFRLCPSLTILSQVATVAIFFSCCSCRC